jgi:TetR/AcrR family transcriptional repressor of nem operon
VKRDTRQAIIEAGAELVHRQGFHRTGLKEILDAAGVPKGSFYFYFPSKEDFGLALIEFYAQVTGERAREILGDAATSPLVRLARFFAMARERMDERGCERGCPIGNLAQELSDLSPAMREALSLVLRHMARNLSRVLAEAVAAGEVAADLDPERTASFILDAWEGAILRMKAEKNTEPLLRFEDFVLNRLLR